MDLEVLIPVIVLGAIFVIYCWADIIRGSQTRLLPKWAWLIISVISIPLGGIVYFIFGRSEMTASHD